MAKRGSTTPRKRPRASRKSATPSRRARAGGDAQILHVISDSTGNLARHMLAAFVTQFPPNAFQIRLHNFIQTRQRLTEALDTIAAAGGIVLHAVVSPQFKQLIESRAREAKLPVCDLTGSFVQFLADASGLSPEPNVQRLHETSDAYRDRIKALEYTLEHDDGLGLATLAQADVVLVGVSRTSKTPTSIYLGQQGYRAANIALAMGVELPKELLELPPHKVAGLTIEPAHLAEIRTNRQIGWRMSATRYNDPDHVAREIAWSRQLFNEHRWRSIDVTDQAVEETAEKVIKLLGLTREGRG